MKDWERRLRYIAEPSDELRSDHEEDIIEALEEIDDLRSIIEKQRFDLDYVRKTCDRLKSELEAYHAVAGFDSCLVESAELERDRAKAETQWAEQKLEILRTAVTFIWRRGRYVDGR